MHLLGINKGGGTGAFTPHPLQVEVYKETSAWKQACRNVNGMGSTCSDPHRVCLWGPSPHFTDSRWKMLSPQTVTFPPQTCCCGMNVGSGVPSWRWIRCSSVSCRVADLFTSACCLTLDPPGPASLLGLLTCLQLCCCRCLLSSILLCVCDRDDAPPSQLPSQRWSLGTRIWFICSNLTLWTTFMSWTSNSERVCLVLWVFCF